MSFSLLGKIASEHVATLQKVAGPKKAPRYNDVPFEADGGILDDPAYKAHMRQMPKAPAAPQKPAMQGPATNQVPVTRPKPAAPFKR